MDIPEIYLKQKIYNLTEAKHELHFLVIALNKEKNLDKDNIDLKHIAIHCAAIQNRVTEILAILAKNGI